MSKYSKPGFDSSLNYLEVILKVRVEIFAVLLQWIIIRSEMLSYMHDPS